METTLHQTTSSAFFNSELADQWFYDFVDTIKIDQVKLKAGVADRFQKNFYRDLIIGNELKLHSSVRDISRQFFIRNILVELSKQIKPYVKEVKKLAVSYSDSSVLCWAVIPDDREDLEDALIMAKAEIDAAYCDHGFTLSLTILEESDKVSTPPHYQSLI